MNAPTDLQRLTADLDDKYRIDEGWAFMTGTQALVRLAIQQRKRDAAAGHNTGGYITGYRGSPLGQYDQALWKAGAHLQAHNIVFRAGLNEELAATALSGTQYLHMHEKRRVDGVFGIWYGKAPGVDRAADALRHGNWAGTSALGGVLALAGDDHGAKSSTIACYSDPMFEALGMPLLYPASTQEVLDLGLHGIAMSRFSGLWVGFKCVTDIIEAGSPVHVSLDSPKIVLPQDFVAPEGGMGNRPFELSLLPLEERIYHHRIYAALAYARANGLNRILHGGHPARIGIVSAGKAYQDLEQALSRLGIDAERARSLGLRVLRIGMTWPLDPQIVREFAEGLQTLIVVEEKRPFLENQMRAILYGMANPPRLIGKLAQQHVFDGRPQPDQFVFPNFGETTAAMVAQALSDAFHAIDPQCGLPRFSPETCQQQLAAGAIRTPSFCSGCPHNRSTKLPEGSRGLAGIGCHGMAVMLDPKNYQSIAQMGGEGMHWLGQQPFTEEEHVFANMGDGTYSHSGFLAIRQAAAAHSPITFKILFNGFVSMTGGQPLEGEQTVPQILQAVHAEGIRKLAVVTDDVQKYQGLALPPGTTVHERTLLDSVQREFREYRDTSVIVYDQACATERRRLRKKGQWEDPAKRTFINSAVCEGCGDCGKVSTCLSIEALDTPLGRKRRINQSSCNKDFTCIEGFCPSFVTVHGGKPRKPVAASAGQGEFAPLSDPRAAERLLPRDSSEAFSILVCGIGGTGVVTIGQVLAMAAHLDGLHCTSLDVMGMAQKYGAVLSHVRLARAPEHLHATRIGAGETGTLIGCDLIVATGDEALRTLRRGMSHAVVCSDLIATAEFPRNPDWDVPTERLVSRLHDTLGGEALTVLEGQRLATALLGDAIAANMFMVGVAWQKGQIPLSLEAIERAIELNGVAIELNRQAFLWGRRAAAEPLAVEKAAVREAVVQFVPRKTETLAAMLEVRRQTLALSAGEAVARRYTDTVDRVAALAASLGQGDALARAVAVGYFKVLYVKDEWEVARLYAHPDFQKSLNEAFEGDFKLRFHVGAWPFAKREPVTGKVIKGEVGSWMLPAFRAMTGLRFLRGTWLDPFRGNAERVLERDCLARYEEDLDEILRSLSARTHASAVALARLPERFRGYGPVKAASVQAAQQERAQWLARLRAPESGDAKPAQPVGQAAEVELA